LTASLLVALKFHLCSKI